MIKKLSISLICLNLGACASIVEGSTQEVSIDTNPSMAASCKLTNDRGSWKTHTPNQVSVKRSKSDLLVECESQTHIGEFKNSSDAETWTGGNILIGGVIGLGVDSATGAMFSYDDMITVPMTAKQTPMPLASDQSMQYQYAPAAYEPPAEYQYKAAE